MLLLVWQDQAKELSVKARKAPRRETRMQQKSAPVELQLHTVIHQRCRQLQ